MLNYEKENILIKINFELYQKNSDIFIKSVIENKNDFHTMRCLVEYQIKYNLSLYKCLYYTNRVIQKIIQPRPCEI